MTAVFELAPVAAILGREPSKMESQIFDAGERLRCCGVMDCLAGSLSASCPISQTNSTLPFANLSFGDRSH